MQWASMRCDVTHGKCVLNECQDGYYNFNGITCFQNCYLAIHISLDCDHGNCVSEPEQYCCSSLEYKDNCKGQGHCVNPDYTNGFSGCMDVDVHLTDVYHACLDEQLGTTDQYTSIYCTSGTCAITTSLDNLSLLSGTCVYQF